MAGPAELVTCDQTIERLMNRRKQFRAVATRFDKLAVRYQATIAVADSFIWLRARPTGPAAIRESRLSVMVGEPPTGVVDYDAVVAGSQTRCPRWLRWLG
jgi:hypothetical protein